ncbi:MAG: hypothetical protein JWO02_4211, partial [Solirubrobacterales bacterium]|nr:hypothetical protein [Solirubrobacterales bacterium]
MADLTVMIVVYSGGSGILHALAARHAPRSLSSLTPLAAGSGSTLALPGTSLIGLRESRWGRLLVLLALATLFVGYVVPPGSALWAHVTTEPAALPAVTLPAIDFPAVKAPSAKAAVAPHAATPA